MGEVRTGIEYTNLTSEQQDVLKFLKGQPKLDPDQLSAALATVASSLLVLSQGMNEVSAGVVKVFQDVEAARKPRP